MANTLITPSVIADSALATLYESMAMLPLVYTDVTTQFAGQAKGNTINIRKPATFTANEFDRATGIVVQDATESTVPVVLNKIADVSFGLTSEDLTMKVTDLEQQFLDPAMEAIAQKIDASLIALKADVSSVVGTGTNVGAAAPGEATKSNRWQQPEVLIDAGNVLDIKKVPVTQRFAVTGPTTKAWWSDTNALKNAEKSGSTETLRLGSLGRNLFGFDTFWSQNIVQPAGSPASGQPTTEVSLAFHKTAFAFASTPFKEQPGANSEQRTYKGLTLRVTWQYDIKYKQTIFSVDILYGVKTLDANRAVLIRGPLAA